MGKDWDPVPGYRGVYRNAAGTHKVWYQATEVRDGKQRTVQKTRTFAANGRHPVVDHETGSVRMLRAREAAIHAKAEADNARRAGRVRNVDEDTITLATYFEKWLERPSKRTGEKRRASTEENSLRPTFRKWIAPAFGNVPLRSITKSQVLDWDAWLHENAGPAARNKAVRTLAAILAAAEREFDYFTSPARVLSGAADGTRAITEEELLTDEQIARLRQAIDPRYALMIDLLSNGLRIGEVCGLRKIDVNLKGDVHVRRQIIEVGGRLVEGPPKNAEHVVPVPFLRDEIQRHIGQYAQPEPDGYIFTSSRGLAPVSPSNWRTREFFPALERAKLPRITPHFLRHRCAWDLLDRGYSTAQVADWIGDTEGMILRVYGNHPKVRSKAEIAEHLGERYRANGHTSEVSS